MCLTSHRTRTVAHLDRHAILVGVLGVGLLNVHSAQLTTTEAFVMRPASATVEDVRCVH